LTDVRLVLEERVLMRRDPPVAVVVVWSSFDAQDLCMLEGFVPRPLDVSTESLVACRDPKTGAGMAIEMTCGLGGHYVLLLLLSSGAQAAAQLVDVCRRNETV
jgi:hypothetical protein